MDLVIPQSPTELHEVVVITRKLNGPTELTVRYDLLFKDALHHLDEFNDFLTDPNELVSMCEMVEIPGMNHTNEEFVQIWHNRKLKGL